MELDHVFVFTETDAPERSALEALGLVESHRRAHPGQGTANICYAFDNAYLELIWLTDRVEATSPAIARTQLAVRSGWRDNGASPFGIAWRGTPRQPIETWPYRPPYLPSGHAIPVAVDCDAAAVPLLFQSPATQPPRLWGPEQSGARQTAAGFDTLRIEALVGPRLTASAAVGQVASALGFDARDGERHAMTLVLGAGRHGQRIALPLASA